MDKIEKNSLSLLHKLYRYATKIKGSKESFKDLASVMNRKSKTITTDSPDDTSKERKIISYQLYRWFKNNGGKELSPVVKPFDNPKLIKERLE